MFQLYKNALTKSTDFISLEKNVREGVSPLSVFGVSDGQKTHLAAALSGAEKVKNDFEF